MTTPVDLQLDDFAAVIGVAIDYAPLPADRDGEYDHPSRTIRLRPGMAARHHRSVLAHELAHAVFGDVPSKFGPVNAKQERRAEEWAALRLITLDDYRHVESIHRGHAGAMALDLGVMRSIVLAYRGLLERHGDTTYVRPRLGAGQYDHREQVA